jgi:multidrug efflux system membrane fusion protein
VAPPARRPQERRGRRLALAFSLLLLTAACDEAPRQAAGGPPPPPPVEVAKPLVREIVEDDEFIGRFQAVDRVEVRARVDGYLQTIHFTDGALVQAGDLLFTIDQRPFQARLTEAQASVNSAQAVLTFAKEDLDRAVALLGRGNISQQTVDERRQSFEVAAAQLAQAQAVLAGVQLDLEYTEIRAPLAGRIDERLVSEGNLVRANDTLLTTIVSQDPVYFYFDIDERSFLAYARDARARDATLQQGGGSLPVKVRLVDAREAVREGVLDFAQNVMDEGTGTMRVRAVFPNADGVLLPGLFGRINVPGSLPHPGVLVPDEAIAADQERRIVYLVDDKGLVTPRVVRPGPRIDGYRVIREGLTGEETIVVNGLMRVRPGVTVTPQLVVLPPTRE